MEQIIKDNTNDKGHFGIPGIIAPLSELGGIENIINYLKRDTAVAALSGCTDVQKAHTAALLACGGTALLVSYREQKARELLENIRPLRRDVMYFPARDVLFYQADIRGNALSRERMKALEAICGRSGSIIVTTFDALMDMIPSPDNLRGNTITLKRGGIVETEALRMKLVQNGYEYSFQAEEPGQFAVRGGIIDIFPFTGENPCRIELWDDEIDSMRTFSPGSQRSIEEIDEISIFPASDAPGSLAESGAVSFFDFFRMCTDAPLTIIDEPKRSLEAATGVYKEYIESIRQRFLIKAAEASRGETSDNLLEGQGSASRDSWKGANPEESILVSPEIIAGKLRKEKCVLLASTITKVKELPAKLNEYVNVQAVSPYNGSFTLLTQDLRKFAAGGYRAVLLCRSEGRGRRLADDIIKEGIRAFFTNDSGKVPAPGEVMLLAGSATTGYACPEIRYVVMTDTDIFGKHAAKKKKPRYTGGERVRSYTDLSVGDYVVHESHGLGIYRGIESIETDHVLKDYMKIEYKKGTLYVLATQSELIQKYTGGGSPKLNTLGGQEWNRTKSRVRGAVKDIARELVQLYAERQQRQGFEFGEDTVWQREFEEMFPYEETGDQLRAIAEVKRDMQSNKIMDRLICGDVGFGKTEIAVRAAFKAVQDGKQVAFLVPTTILAQQHFDLIRQRMKNFAVNVELLCRFRTPAEQRRTVKGLASGAVDIVIGTHRLLSADVKFKDLGLLVIDEEQRFGVSHKEKIKKMKTGVDVLSLSATPIPRTLHMSLSGIREMSLLSEPPQDRLPIQTYVLEYDPELIREAISREISRGGQVYFVYNRVNYIAEMTAEVARLVPEARVSFAHGQMNERELEDVMHSFINREIDVLVSTTIIETGLDISNVNTMIVCDADRLGLSQLYQLRGRIGRTNRTSYAFLTYRRDKVLKEVAEKRLSAIREFSELGSGFKIAMKDLEIRGAGDLLGASQHGHMEAVGYELYCKLLNTAVREEKGEEVGEEFSTTIDIKSDAHIPDSYIPNEYQKLDIYKSIARIKDENDRDEMEAELLDRFGKLPKEVANLLRVAKLRAVANRLFITEIKETARDITLVFRPDAKINTEGIPALVNEFSPGIAFHAYKDDPCFVYAKNPDGAQTIEWLDTFLERAKELLAT